MENLKNIGLKTTPQRMAIMEFLEGNTDHPSADDIYKNVSQKFPAISFATVYNTLEALRSKGMILALTIDPEKKRFDFNTKPHHHLICLNCKCILDIHQPYDLRVSELEAGGFELIGNHIEFYGVCSDCRKKITPEQD